MHAHMYTYVFYYYIIQFLVFSSFLNFPQNENCFKISNLAPPYNSVQIHLFYIIQHVPYLQLCWAKYNANENRLKVRTLVLSISCISLQPQLYSICTRYLHTYIRMGNKFSRDFLSGSPKVAKFAERGGLLLCRPDKR